MDALKTGRLTGLLYLIVAVVGAFGLVYVPATLVAPGDPTTTATNIVASEGLFRVGIVSDLIVFLIEIALVVLLYMLLRPVNTTLALVSALFRLGMTILQVVDVLADFTALQLLSGADHLTSFDPDQLHSLALTFLEVGAQGELIWEAAFGLHLATLGYLIYKSGYIPRAVGVLVAIAGLGYLIDSFGTTLLPGHAGTFTAIVTVLAPIPEASFPLWLVFRGARSVEPVTTGT